MPADICSCSTTDTAGQIVHRPGCSAAYTVGLVVPAPGVGPPAASTVTVVATCPAHPGAIFDACGPCLREAYERAEKAEAERDAAVAEAGVASREAARRDRSASKAAAALGGVWQPEDWDEGALTGFVLDLAADRDACRREAAEAQEADAISRRLLARQCDLARGAEAERDAARRLLSALGCVCDPAGFPASHVAGCQAVVERAAREAGGRRVVWCEWPDEEPKP